VIWADNSSIKSKPVDAGEHMSFAVIANDVGFNPISGFVISDNQIYIGESSDDNIEMAPLMPGKNAGAREATVIAWGQMKPTRFAADPRTSTGAPTTARS